MSIRLRAFACGFLTADRGLFLEGESGSLRIPVPSYLIEHPKGRVLFDSGLHPEMKTDPKARIGGLARLFVPDFGPEDDVASRLTMLDVDPERVEFLVNSHLHFDHTGGNVSIPNAQLVIQRREWEAGQDSDQCASNTYDPRDYDLGHDLCLVDGEHDLFGDGSVVCIPTHGHTPGHQSLRVRLDSGDVLLCGDACYMRQSLEAMQLPPTVHDREEMLESLRRIAALEQAGVRLFFGHDPDLWRTLPQAPEAIG